MHLPEVFILITVLPVSNSKTVKKLFKVCFLQNLIICFLVCPFMTAMTGDKGVVIYDPPPCMNKVAEYFGTIRVKNSNTVMENII